MGSNPINGSKKGEGMYLVRFTYDFYCQGYEDATETVLVKALSFDMACRKIAAKYRNAREFQNLTLD